MTLHNFVVGGVYFAMVITPCIIALFSGVDRTDESEVDASRDGFI